MFILPAVGLDGLDKGKAVCEDGIFQFGVVVVGVMVLNPADGFYHRHAFAVL